MDKFYTNPEIIPPLLNHLDLSDYDCILEPSAGNGSFSLQLQDLHSTILSYDIEPANDSIIQADFLEHDLVLDIYTSVLMIGNPPFGKQCSKAIQFFNRGASYDNIKTIAMIFPKSFRKSSIQKRLDRSFHLYYEIDIPLDSFLLDNVIYNVPCIFQIWKRQNSLRDLPIMEKLNNPLLRFVKKDQAKENFKAVIVIRRVGFYAGRCYDYNDQNEQSHLFLRVTSHNKKLKNQIIDYLENIKWSHEDTVGPRSVSKQDLIKKLNKRFEKSE